MVRGQTTLLKEPMKTYTLEQFVYSLWKPTMHPEWRDVFEQGFSLVHMSEDEDWWHESSFTDFFRLVCRACRDDTAESRLLRLLTARLLIIYCNRMWDIELELDHAYECIKKMWNVEYISTIIRCYLLNHSTKYFPALGWIWDENLEAEMENQKSVARSRIFRTNLMIQPIDANAQSVAPLPWDQLFRDR